MLICRNFSLPLKFVLVGDRVLELAGFELDELTFGDLLFLVFAFFRGHGGADDFARLFVDEDFFFGDFDGGFVGVLAGLDFLDFDRGGEGF